MKPLILASQSPRRAKILQDMGLKFSVVKTDSQEVSFPDDPERTVKENAVLKLKACLEDCKEDVNIIAADTIVWFNDKIYGKPKDLDEARVFLRELSGNTHTVFTGVAFYNGGEISVVVSRSDVTFKTLSEEYVNSYVETVKPTDRAGAYDIDENGDMIVASFTGEYENIMGLPTKPIKAFLAIDPLHQF